MSCGVEVRTGMKKGQVRLRLALLMHPNGVLHPNDGGVSCRLHEVFGKAGDTSGMSMADWRHLGNLAVDQFEAIVFAENARLGHPMVLGYAEPPSGRAQRHRGPPGISTL